VQNSGRRAGPTSAGKLAGISVAAGLVAGAIALPAVGIVGLAARDAARTFNTLSVPSIGQLPLRSEILDSKGNVIAYYYPGGTAKNPGSTDRVPVTYSQIAPVMRDAIVAQEDARFWQHGAFDPKGALRAILNDLHGNATQGGSDLAQQYVKNALLLTATTRAEQVAATAPSLARKLIELRIAANVEHELTRPQLLAAYLNAAYFDNAAYGIQVAAERYFSTTAAHLTLPEAAMLAGMVEFPDEYNPRMYPTNTLDQRNVVLSRMEQLHYITPAQEKAAQNSGLGLHWNNYTLQSGCTAPSARRAAFFCSYVQAVLQKNPAYAAAERALNHTGGLKIYTTLNPKDQRAAQNAVTYVEPAHLPQYNPNRNADVEVLIQPRTGYIRAIAEDRTYGFGRGQTTVDYAVNQEYGGSAGVQTGSSSKIFTLLTALKQNVPFGFTEKVVSPTTIGGFTNCKNEYVSPWVNLVNAEGNTKKPEIFSLYTGTTQSINIFYGHLEQHVGLCNVVKTAVSLGVTRADGRSLFQGVGNPRSATYQYPADNVTSFTLGSVYVSPMSMAAAYATVASGGKYCTPIAISKIVTATGRQLPVESADCHRVFSAQVADAANYILQGVLTTGTASNRGIGIPAAAKTGTANSGYYAAFAGWTPRLAGYVSVFNPIDPTRPAGQMLGVGSCYREVSGFEACPGQMYGDNAPGATWQYTFLHLLSTLGHPAFTAPTDPVFFSKGNGIISPTPPSKHHGGHGHGGGGGGHGGGPPPVGPPIPPGPGGGGGGH
jgi:membrane peptidoglycan carboxypeptidase